VRQSVVYSTSIWSLSIGDEDFFFATAAVADLEMRGIQRERERGEEKRRKERKGGGVGGSPREKASVGRKINRCSLYPAFPLSSLSTIRSLY